MPRSEIEIRRFECVTKMRDIEFARMGMRVEIDGRPGIIVGANDSANLDVILDGQTHRSNVHPHWETVYFDDNGQVLRDYRTKRGMV